MPNENDVSQRDAAVEDTERLEDSTPTSTDPDQDPLWADETIADTQSENASNTSEPDTSEPNTSDTNAAAGEMVSADTMDSETFRRTEQAEIIVHDDNAPAPMMGGQELKLQLREKLGEGGMGEVWGASASDLNREVAVKVLSRRSAHDAEARRRFQREANITAQLAHPNVIPVYSTATTAEGLPAFSMKWVRGQTLFEFMKGCRKERDQGELSEEHSEPARLDLFLKVCDAIAYSHDVGVIHRDLKPSNFMIGDFNEIYVMDWGMARRTNETSAAQHDTIEIDDTDLSATVSGAVMGTPMYMAPEQARGEAKLIGPASDQFALGLILFALYTLRPARKADTVPKMLELARSGRSIAFRRGELPPALQAIISKATEAAPADRYASVKALADDVRRFARGRRVRAHHETVIQRVRRNIQNHPSVTLSVTLLAVVVGLLSAAGGLYQAFESERSARIAENELVKQISGVNQTAQNVERYLLRLQSLQMAIAEALQLRLQQRRPYPETAKHQSAFGSIEDGKFVPLPGTATADSVLAMSWMLAQSGDHATAQRQRRYLGRIEPRLRQAMLHAIDPSLCQVGMRDEQVIRRLMQENSVRYIYVGLSSGLLLNFPGITLPEGYDPRLRPWYKGALETQFTSWGAIYPDASGSGYLVPCNSVIRDVNGKILGVVGLDISTDQLLEHISDVPLDNIRRIMLATRQGRVVLQSTDRGMRTVADIAENQAREGVKLPYPPLVAIAKEGTKTGAITHGDEMYVYAPLPALKMMLIVTVSP